MREIQHLCDSNLFRRNTTHDDASEAIWLQEGPGYVLSEDFDSDNLFQKSKTAKISPEKKISDKGKVV